MWTMSYKGQYIHGYCDRDEVHVGGRYFKSLQSAKIAITKGRI